MQLAHQPQRVTSSDSIEQDPHATPLLLELNITRDQQLSLIVITKLGSKQSTNLVALTLHPFTSAYFIYVNLRNTYNASQISAPFAHPPPLREHYEHAIQTWKCMLTLQRLEQHTPGREEHLTIRLS